jgi:hypothetical protein
MRERRFYYIVSAICLLAVTLPYLIAFAAGGEERIFAGFLVNPLDGHSYLAKMRQGYQGDWRFQLPYTADPGQGGYLFLLYISLGHLARILKVPLPLLFHGTRLVFTVLMLVALTRFWEFVFDQGWKRKLAFSISVLGSGMGWTALLAGGLTADFWVAETYPFLSAYVNPHFPLGLALMLCLIRPNPSRDPVFSFLFALLLGMTVPFGVVLVLLVRGTWMAVDILTEWADLWHNILRDKNEWLDMILIALGGGSMLIYQYWLVQTDPVMAGWHAQNVTQTPPLWDVTLSLSPVLILALVGMSKAWENKRQREVLIWAVLGLGLIFVPWRLQRRFMTGLYIPLVGMAVLGVERLVSWTGKNRRSLLIWVHILVLPTNLILILSGLGAVRALDERIYLTRSERQALSWLEQQGPEDAVVLAGPETGLFIPAYTGKRVIYGHPFETVNAEKKKALVEAYAGGKLTAEEQEFLLKDQKIHYAWWGQRESAGERGPYQLDLTPVYENETVTIYSAAGEP